ncbi:MAG: helix-turn-helix domain-containing protein [Lachnospiraceae bacterium]|nr:helix-turn-helix domain-containing protein [Lachnospiraceae bacterium]
MNQVVIVDDETIIRVTLRSLLVWESLGFHVAADFSGGKPALEYLRKNRADLLIVDMKMPDLNGIVLMEKLKEEGILPLTIVLSGYNEFSLVREAFRIGAYDYLLKSDLSRESLLVLLQKLKQTIFLDGGRDKTVFSDAVEESLGIGQLEGEHGMVLFSVDEGMKQTARFGEDLGEYLQKPVLELARQLPRVAARGKLAAVDPLHYVLAYKAGDKVQYRHTIISVVRQLQSVWRDYMNLTLSAAVSDPACGEVLFDKLKRGSSLIKLAVLCGKNAFCAEWEWEEELEIYLREEEARADEGLFLALYGADVVALEEKKRRFFEELSGLTFEKGRSRCLVFIARLAAVFEKYGDDFFGLFPDEADYREKLAVLQSDRELELWMNNFLRWVTDYIENRHDTVQADAILRAKRFLSDNYANPELTLKSVADYVGLNEKYLSTRFTKEAGTTFSAYLTDLRMQKAKNLMISTDLRMYEISERVGYHNVEHFNRMFKKSFGFSPGDFRKNGGRSGE